MHFSGVQGEHLYLHHNFQGFCDTEVKSLWSKFLDLCPSPVLFGGLCREARPNSQGEALPKMLSVCISFFSSCSDHLVTLECPFHTCPGKSLN